AVSAAAGRRSDHVDDLGKSSLAVGRARRPLWLCRCGPRHRLGSARPARHLRRAAVSRRSVLVVLVVAVAVVGGIVYRYAAGGARETSPTQTSRSSTSRAHTTRRSAVSRVPTRLVERSTGRLPAPLQDAAAAATGNRTMLMLGGLTAADTSTNSILLTNVRGASRRGVLPTA